MRFPFTSTAAPEGTLVSHTVPPKGCRTTAGISWGLEPTSTSRRSSWYPGMLIVTVWRPGAPVIAHGVVQAVSGLPSMVAVAPPGLLMIVTGCGVACGRRDGGRFVAGSDSGSVGLLSTGGATGGI